MKKIKDIFEWLGVIVSLISFVAGLVLIILACWNFWKRETISAADFQTMGLTGGFCQEIRAQEELWASVEYEEPTYQTASDPEEVAEEVTEEVTEAVIEEDPEEEPEVIAVECTAYCDDVDCYGNATVEGLTCAGKREWLGCTVAIYERNSDGSVGDFIGFWEFRDVGYGQPTGRGESKLKEGRSLGTIEAGECIDIYIPTERACQEWGRRKVYIQIINAVG